MSEFIAYCARVSNPNNQHNHQTGEKLLSYLIKNKHWSPFEMANIVIEINTTRDIARQILRHRSFSFQEFSQRYAVANEFEYSECRMQDVKNRQNSLETTDDELNQWWLNCQKNIKATAMTMYSEALDYGIAKEVARKILPEGIIMSKMYVQGSVRSWMHYCNVRCGPETQKEHRQIALACRSIVVGELEFDWGDL